jgi:hypothetical protein
MVELKEKRERGAQSLTCDFYVYHIILRYPIACKVLKVILVPLQLSKLSALWQLTVAHELL